MKSLFIYISIPCGQFPHWKTIVPLGNNIVNTFVRFRILPFQSTFPKVIFKNAHEETVYRNCIITSWHDGDPWAQCAVKRPVQLLQGWDHLQHLGSFIQTGCPSAGLQWPCPSTRCNSPCGGSVSDSCCPIHSRCFGSQKPVFQVLTWVQCWRLLWNSCYLSETMKRMWSFPKAWEKKYHSNNLGTGTQNNAPPPFFSKLS